MRTPILLVDRIKLTTNIEAMQAICSAHGVQLWPHIKTHKTVEIARLQLAAGAAGLTCAKLGEAEALLPSGVRRIFIAYPLVDPDNQADRLRRLVDSLDELFVAATSLPQAQALGQVLAATDFVLPVLIGIDSGLGREGTRGVDDAVALADFVRQHPLMRLSGIFTHEGHAYRGVTADDAERTSSEIVAHLRAVREAVGPADDGQTLTLWPGCSVTAAIVATLLGVHAVRPGTYVFRDLSLSKPPYDDVALTILTTVVDRPEPSLALIDAGSKTFSSDKTSADISASAADGRDLHVTRLSEEHGFVTGADVDELRVGDRIAWVPAHVCPTVNLADTLTVVSDGEVVTTWRVAARGKNY